MSMKRYITFCLALGLIIGLLVGKAMADTLMLPTPCFDTNIEIDPGYVLEVRTIHDSGSAVLVERTGYPNVIKVSVCGVGDWLIETRTGSECIEWVGYRRVTTLPCKWSEWLETVNATVSDQSSPDVPRFALKRDMT